LIHCTVCGAAAREGAKFCTSCGARLMDTSPIAPAATTSDDSAPLATANGDTATSVPVPAESGVDTAWAPGTATDDAEPETEEVPSWADISEPAEPAVAEAEPSPEPEAPAYASNWPEPEAAAGDDVTQPADEAASTTDAPVEAAAWTSWSTTTEAEPVALEAETPQAEPEPEPEPETQQVDEEATAATASPGVEPNAGMEASHHGASQWESWEPAASGEATVPSSTSDAAASVRRLLDDLANRIDRLISPASVESRAFDPDDLADQLERWARPTPGSADLLEVVQAVRKAPRDLDAISRLADRAADLELLVRRYQSIASSSGEWARELRERRAAGTDES
jgi:hypothetical protein